MTRPDDEPLPPRRTKPPRPRPVEPNPFETEPEAPSTFRPNSRRNQASLPPTQPDTENAPLPRPGEKKSRSSKLRAEKEVKPVTGGPSWVERIIFGKVSSAHLARFCRQFGSYLEAGVDLLRSLDNLQKQFSRTALGPVLDRVAIGVRRGDSLSDAMRREPGAFDSRFLAMMTVAEARGGVPETLRVMAESYESRQRLTRQAISAMIYPVAVLLIGFAVGMLLTVFILPGLVEILQDMVRGRSIEIPLPTRILFAVNKFMIGAGWWAVPLATVGSVFGLIWLYKRPAGKSLLDEVALRIPVLGKLLRMIDITRFSRTLSALLEAGVDIGGSLALTADTLTLTPMRRAILAARELIMEGGELSEVLEASHRFPHDVISIVGSGEETGKLPESLERLADDYEERVEMMVKNLGSLIQPILFLAMGGVVLFIAIAFFSVYIMLLTNIM